MALRYCRSRKWPIACQLVSAFEHIMIDFEHRGGAGIDIPVVLAPLKKNRMLSKDGLKTTRNRSNMSIMQ